MIKQLFPSGKWFVFDWNASQLVMLAGPFNSSGAAQAVLDVYTAATDPIITR